MARFKHLIFDLDGTLLDTIEDICLAINTALEKCGYPQRFNRETTKALIGDGADALIRRALLEKGSDLQAFSQIKPIYMELYRIHQVERAKPFDGLVNVLNELKDRGVDFCCVTNKPEPLAYTILEMHYGEGFFQKIIGASEEYPVKPHPASTNACIEMLRFKKEDCLYVGDSHVDVETGHNAGLPVALCLWGYETDYPKAIQTADFVLKTPEDLLSLF